MEVEDRHLNVIVDLINDMLIDCEPLSYLSEQFSPQDMVWRLSQLIIKYEKNILSDSELIVELEYDINDNSLSACSAIRVWLLDYYRSDFVTLNECKLENGVEEEIVLTALMVLRVFYTMRQMLDFRFNQVLSKGWKDLHEFDQQLDEKFETRCFKLMTLLVKHSVKNRLEVEQLVKQINSLIEEKSVLEEKFRTINQNNVKPVSNQIRVNRTRIRKLSDVCDNNEISLKSANLSNRIITNSAPNLRVIPLSPKSASNVTISASLPVLTHNRNTFNSKNNFETSNSSIPPLFPPKAVPIRPKSTRISLTPKKQNTNTRRSLRISNSSTAKLNGNEITPQNTIREIEAIFNETDDSEFEYFDNQSSAQLTKPIALPPKKRKPQTTQTIDKIINPPIRKKSAQSPTKKSSKSHSWPSRNKVYPRRKRYPCEYPDCGYIADRPSTLVRHSRAHTGEKPYLCDWPGCDKRYKMSSNLTPHKLTHTGERPYKCDWSQCNKRFTYPQHLKRHRIAHQKRTKLKRSETTSVSSNVSKRRKQEVAVLSSV